MKILFVDTTTCDLVVAVLRDDKIFQSTVAGAERRHSELLCSKVAEALAAAEMSFDDVEAYACAIGPGSFTGIRIGVSTVKGYCTAVARPYIAVNCLEAISFSANCGAKGSATVDAGNSCYFADYVGGVAPCLIPYDDERILSAGKGTAIDYLDGAIKVIRDRFEKKCFDGELKPLYIRRSQAEENRK